MRVSVVSAERSVFDGEADGLVGILPRHAPFMTLLGQGIVQIRQSGGNLTRLQVMGGFLQVASNVVRIVARRAGPTET